MAELEEAERALSAYRQSVAVVTCVYCGHEYPEGTPTAKAEQLTAHIKVCEKHPLRAAEERIKQLEALLSEAQRTCVGASRRGDAGRPARERRMGPLTGRKINKGNKQRTNDDNETETEQSRRAALDSGRTG